MFWVAVPSIYLINHNSKSEFFLNKKMIKLISVFCLMVVYVYANTSGQHIATYTITTPVIHSHTTYHDDNCFMCLPSIDKMKTTQTLGYKTETFVVYQTQPKPNIFDRMQNTYEQQNQRYYGGLKQYKISETRYPY